MIQLWSRASCIYLLAVVVNSPLHQESGRPLKLEESIFFMNSFRSFFDTSHSKSSASCEAEHGHTRLMYLHMRYSVYSLCSICLYDEQTYYSKFKRISEMQSHTKITFYVVQSSSYWLIYIQKIYRDHHSSCNIKLYLLQVAPFKWRVSDGA